MPSRLEQLNEISREKGAVPFLLFGESYKHLSKSSSKYQKFEFLEVTSQFTSDVQYWQMQA